MIFGNPVFPAYARAYGATGHRIETADGLIPALQAAFRDGGVHLIAVPVDYSGNKRVLVDELRRNSISWEITPVNDFAYGNELQ